jgi:mitofilin
MIQRSYADNIKGTIKDSKPAVLPGSLSEDTIEPEGPVATTINSQIPSASRPDQTIPVQPPSPKDVGAVAPPPTVAPAAKSTLPPPPPPPTRKPRRILRKFFATLLLLTLAGFGGGVYYSRINDNFHDFFTEYIPFGEEAVLYLEERDFKKRFPNIHNKPKVRDAGERVTIPSSSGVSWSVAKDEPVKTEAQKADKKERVIKDPSEQSDKALVKTVEAAKTPGSSEKPAQAAPSPTNAKAAAPAAEPVAAAPAAAEAKPKKTPHVNEPSVYISYVERVDPLAVPQAAEPVVQDLVKVLNDIILVINADKAGNKFGPTIKLAKDELAKVGSKIEALKAKADADADKMLRDTHAEFDRAAKELLRRVDAEMVEVEAKWKREYEEERNRVKSHYEERLKAEVAHNKEVTEQKLKNELLEQALELKKAFAAQVKSRVEEERNSRLGKLGDLEKSVHDLEALASNLNTVVDANLKTQHLHVAVEAVRASLENQTRPKPFVRELAALKEIAQDDDVVNAAIASINPVAYQRGIATPSQLIDRFRRVAGEVRKASLLPEEAGVASHASSYVLSKLLFKKKGLADGDDVESVLTRTETYLEEGNLEGAAREMNGLRGWAKTLSRDWLAECRKRLEVEQALDVSPPSFYFPCAPHGVYAMYARLLI